MHERDPTLIRRRSVCVQSVDDDGNGTNVRNSKTAKHCQPDLVDPGREDSHNHGRDYLAPWKFPGALLGLNFCGAVLCLHTAVVGVPPRGRQDWKGRFSAVPGAAGGAKNPGAEMPLDVLSSTSVFEGGGRTLLYSMGPNRLAVDSDRGHTRIECLFGSELDHLCPRPHPRLRGRAF